MFQRPVSQRAGVCAAAAGGGGGSGAAAPSHGLRRSAARGCGIDRRKGRQCQGLGVDTDQVRRHHGKAKAARGRSAKAAAGRRGVERRHARTAAKGSGSTYRRDRSRPAGRAGRSAGAAAAAARRLPGQAASCRRGAGEGAWGWTALQRRRCGRHLHRSIARHHGGSDQAV